MLLGCLLAYRQMVVAPVDGGAANTAANVPQRPAPAQPAPQTPAPVGDTPGGGSETPPAPAGAQSDIRANVSDAVSAGAEPPTPENAHLPRFFTSALGSPPGTTPEDLLKGSPPERQATLEREPRDEAWAARVEWQLENYLALQEFNAELGAPTVECRTTVCRVLATTDKQTLAAEPEADWQEMMSRLRYETVADEFVRTTHTIVYNHSQPERVGFVTYLTRVPEERREDGTP